MAAADVPKQTRRPVPVGQHFIPRLHLKHFAGEQPKRQVWTYDKQSGRSWSAAADNTAVESHFYSAELDDGTMDTRIEEMLSTVETKAAPIYEAALKGHLPAAGTQERVDFSIFLALMKSRTPAMRRMYGELLSRGWQITAYAYGIHDGAFETLVRRQERESGLALTDQQKKELRESLVDPSASPLRWLEKQLCAHLGWPIH